LQKKIWIQHQGMKTFIGLQNYGYDEVEPSITQISQIDFGTGIVMRDRYDSKVILNGPFSKKLEFEKLVAKKSDIESYRLLNLFL